MGSAGGGRDSRDGLSLGATMYKSFYHCKRKPFTTEAEVDFFWPGACHRRALASLEEFAAGNNGFALLLGDPGSGKSCLLKVLLAGLPASVHRAVVTDCGSGRLDFYNAVAGGFGLPRQNSSKVAFLIQFSQFLHQAEAKGEKVLLLVDDCHLLSQEVLAELRMLGNIVKGGRRLLGIVFSGREQFAEILSRPKNRLLRQCLATTATLGPLDPAETESYIRHRLQVAGANEALFTVGAVELLHGYSGGLPRSINTLCERALTAGASSGLAVIDHRVVVDCARTLGLAEGLPAVPGRDSADERSGARFRPKFAGKTRSSGREAIILPVLRGAASLFLALLLVLLSGRAVVQPPPPPPLPPPAATLLVEAPLAAVLAGETPVPAAAETELVAEGPASVAPAGEIPAEEPPVAQAPVFLASGEEELAEEDLPGGGGMLAGQELQEGTSGPVRQPPLGPRLLRLPIEANGTGLTLEAAEELAAFTGRLADYPGSRLLVKGFVSSDLNSPENMQLSLARAMKVKELLLAEGVAPERVEVQAMGGREPLAANTTRAGREQNRRVEIEVVDDGTAPP
jgi:general secretion pathway protein A